MGDYGEDQAAKILDAEGTAGVFYGYYEGESVTITSLTLSGGSSDNA